MAKKEKPLLVAKEKPPRVLTAVKGADGLKRCPWQTSHGTLTSGRKLIAIVRTPWPSQAGQRPSPVLNENRDGA